MFRASKPPPRQACSRLKPVCAAALGALWAYGLAPMAQAQQADAPDAGTVEFSRDFIVGGSQSIDLSRFGRANAVPPGAYAVDVFVNQNWAARMLVRFEVQDGGADAQAVFDRGQLERIGVAVKRLPPKAGSALGAGQRLRIEEAVSNAGATFDFNEQRLYLSLPQVALSRNARGYVNPEYWDSGVTAGVLGYDANVYHYGAGGMRSSTQTYLGLNGGVNAGPWRLRHQGTYQNSSQSGSRYQATATFAQRDLTDWRSQLTLGDAFTPGDLFNSTGFRGVRIQSDDRMLPQSMRGYAPTVHGIATTNAQVTVRQGGNVLYQTTVAPGAFEIDDLYPTGYGGDLEVTVLEADGRTQTFRVPYSAVPLSLRPGVNRFNAVLGQLRDRRVSGSPLFAQGTWQRGLSNLVTGYGGATTAPGYNAALLGGALNTSAGAFGLDVTHSITNVPGGGRQSGSSLRGTYSKLFNQTGTNLTLAAYRYSSSGYLSLNEAMQMREQPASGLLWRPRNRAQITLNQSLGQRGGQLYVVGSMADYWSRGGSDLNYSVGYSTSIGRVGFSISASRQRSGDTGRMDTMIYTGITIPLGATRPVMASTSMTHTSEGRTTLQTSVAGTQGADNALSYGVTLSHGSGGGSGASTDGSANLSYLSPFAALSANVGTGAGYTQAGAGIRGAVVVHPGGVTLSQPVSDTIGVVEARDAGGVRVLNATGVRVDNRGYAVVPYLTPYTMNSVDLDPKGLSTDVQLQTTSQQVAPRAGAVTMLRYATVAGRTAIIHARQADGAPLPFGASVYDESGSEIGIVGQASRIVARGLHEQGELAVKWGENASVACRIHYTLPPRQNKADAGYQQIEANCGALAAEATAP